MWSVMALGNNVQEYLEYLELKALKTHKRAWWKMSYEVQEL